MHRILSTPLHFHSYPVLLHLAADAFAGVSASAGFSGSQYTQEVCVLGSPAPGWLLLSLPTTFMNPKQGTWIQTGWKAERWSLCSVVAHRNVVRL